MKIGCIGRTRPAIFDRALVAIELVLALTSFSLVTHFIFRGDVHMTSAKLIDFWSPLPPCHCQTTYQYRYLDLFLGSPPPL